MKTWPHALLGIILCAAMTLVSAGAAPATPTPATRPAQNAPTTPPPRADLLNILGTEDITPNQLRDVKTILLARRELLIIALEGKRARLASLKQTIDETMAAVEKLIQIDETMASFATVLASLQQQLTLARNANMSAQELTLRQAEISRQEAALEERRETIRGRYQFGLLAELTRNRIDCQSDIQDLQAQLTTLESRLTTLDKPANVTK